jgi:hypothetical protein
LSTAIQGDAIGLPSTPQEERGVTTNRTFCREFTFIGRSLRLKAQTTGFVSSSSQARDGNDGESLARMSRLQVKPVAACVAAPHEPYHSDRDIGVTGIFQRSQVTISTL